MRERDASTAGRPARGDVDPVWPDVAGIDATRPDPVHPGRIAGTGTERDTRAHVARLILEHGPATAATLGDRLGLTPAAIRRHLDSLLADGMVEPRDARPQGRRGRGRPARLFAITDRGRSTFYHAYDDTAASALRFLAERLGPAAVEEFARRQVADLERRYGARLRAARPEQRVALLAEALSADGYAASAGHGPGPGPLGGDQLCQHHCPVAHVAAEFPQLCEAETEAFARLLGTPVQRLATIARGDGVCTTHVSPRGLCRGDVENEENKKVTASVAGVRAGVAHVNNASEESGRTST